jgi:hypothetical protein
MKRPLLCSALFLGSLAASVGFSQPPGRGGGGPPMREKGAPPKFELGKILPPHIREQIELTKDQEKELADLEKLVKEKLDKLLTDEQKKKIERAGPPMGGPGGGRGPGGPGGERKPAEEVSKGAPAGIQWFTTLESAKKEAERTGRPILLVSAAPHCAGVPGIW